MDTLSATGSAADRVYAFVRSGILCRRFADTELLAEGRIAEEVGVSRTPVREALLRLEAEGMVRLLPKRGALVLPVGVKESQDLLSTRRLVEKHCATEVLAARRGTALASRLVGLLQAQETAAAAGDLSGYVAADREFHSVIVAAAGNDILCRLYESLRDRQLLMGSVNLLDPDGAMDHDRIAGYIREHAEIAGALSRGDAESVCALIDEHLDHAADRLVGNAGGGAR